MATRHGTAEVTLPSDREILITRHFEAPVEVVWRAITEPRHVLRWWGPDWCPVVACDIDLRVGGTWRYLALGSDGNELAWHGTYREIRPPDRIVTTEVFEGFPDAESVTTMTLTARDGGTTLQTLVLHATPEFRDGHIAAGMEAGMQVTFNRLEDLLAVFDSPAERFRRVAGRFTDRVYEVSVDAWSNPAPCDGWVTRDVVRHMVEWMPRFLAGAGFPLAVGPSVDDDPVAAWTHLVAEVQRLLDDPEMARQEFEMQPIGRHTVEGAIGSILLGDIVIHTWDLARAAGLDETLEADLVAEMLVGMQPLDDMLRQSGHYGPKVEVPADADLQTRLIAFTGRQP